MTTDELVDAAQWARRNGILKGDEPVFLAHEGEEIPLYLTVDAYPWHLVDADVDYLAYGRRVKRAVMVMPSERTTSAPK